MRTLCYILIGSLSFVGCSTQNSDVLTGDDLIAVHNTKVPAVEYSNWIATNSVSLTKEQIVGDLTYRLTRLPSDLLALREVGNDATPSQLTEAKSHYSDLMYFRLEIIGKGHNGELLKKDIQNPEQYNQRVMYASFGVQKDMSMKLGRDSLSCAVCQFERSFDIAPIATFLLAFDADETIGNSSNVTIAYNDQLFNNGIIKFSWNAGEINAYPSIEGTNN